MTEHDHFVRCNDCGGEYVVTTNDIHYYESRGLCLPKRCKPCRRARRQRQMAAEATRDQRVVTERQ